MRISRRAVLGGFAAGLVAPLASPAVIRRARAATALVVASLLARDKPESLVWTHIRDLVEAEMPGAFSFNLVPDAALGGEKEVLEGMRLGSIQASLATLSSLSTWVPQSQLFDLPFLFRDAGHLHAALASGYGEELRRRLAAERLVSPAFINYGARHLLAPEPLRTPVRLQGRRIRVIQSPLHAQLWQGFGALPIALPITEAYNALSSGYVDAMDLTKSAYAGFHLFEVAPHVTETGHIHAAGALIFADGFWSRLGSEERAVLGRAAVAGARRFDELMAADERNSVEVAKAGGAKFHAVEDRSAWEGPARVVWEGFSDRLGGMERMPAVAAMAAHPQPR